MREEMRAEHKGRVCLEDGGQGAFGSKCIRGGNWAREGKSDLYVLQSAVRHETAAASADLNNSLSKIKQAAA